MRRSGVLVSVVVAPVLLAGTGVSIAMERSQMDRSNAVFSSPARVVVGPPNSQCPLAVGTKLPRGTIVRLEFFPSHFFMPWETVDHPNTWDWKPWARVAVANGKASKMVKAKQDGYWRYTSARGSSDPGYLDVYPTSDLSDPGIPGSTVECRL